MNKILVLMVCYSISWAVNLTAAAQGTSTHGGDRVKQLFQQGKYYSAKMVERFSPGTLDQGFDPEAVAWLHAHKPELAELLKASAHRWQEERRSPCAVFAHDTGDSFSMSLPTCKEQVDELLDAAQMLISVGVEHLEPGMGSRVAFAVILAWHNSGAQLRWDRVQYGFDADVLEDSQAVWLADRQKLLVIGRERNGLLFDPFDATHADSPTPSLTSPERVVCLTRHKDGAAVVSARFNVLRVVDESGAPLATSTLTLDDTLGPSTKVTCSAHADSLYLYLAAPHNLVAHWDGTGWRRIPLGAPRRDSTAIATKAGLLLFGGYSLGSDGMLHLSQQATLCREQCVAVAPIPSGAAEAPAEYDGNRLVFTWGGIGAHGTPTSVGYSYDVEANSWQALTASGAPRARQKHSLTYANDRLFVYGGRAQSNSVFDVYDLSDGAMYDTRSRIWQPIDANLTLPLRADHQAVWTGSSLLILGGVHDNASVPSMYTFSP